MTNADSSLPINQTNTKESARVLTLSTTAFTLLFAVWLMFGVIGISIQKELGLTDIQFFWLGATAILSGSIWRLAFGIFTDWWGGKKVFTALLLFTAIPTYLISQATTFNEMMWCSAFLGLAGNSFNIGIAWNSAWFSKQRQGLALGTFGAGNVGASITKMFGPGLIALVPAAGLMNGMIPGGWRCIPIFYTVLLVIMAIALWVLSPAVDRIPSKGRPLSEMLKPLSHMRVWRFSLYYVVVFGAYVALSLTLPKYYMNAYNLELSIAALLTALFIFPASLLRPLGGWLSDVYGARIVMYGVFSIMTIASGLLALPDGALGFSINVWGFTALVVMIGVGMGVGKAAVYKHVPEYFPKDVAAVGGMVGLLGALGGFFLPLMFGYCKTWTGLIQIPFIILFIFTAASFLWMHIVVIGMKRSAGRENAMPEAVTA